MFKNNELVKTKKELTWWERVSPNETCMKVREGCLLWSQVKGRRGVMALISHSRISA